jgi:hypothetical protein
VPYLFQSTIEIGETNESINITIMPNVIIKFDDGLILMEGGTLTADGSAGQIVFTSVDSETYWGGIMFDRINDNLTRLNHCIMQNGGSSIINGMANVFCYFSSPRITNCNFNNSRGWGITLQGSSLVPDTIRRYNNFSDNDSGDIQVLPESLFTSLKQIVKKQISKPVIHHFHQKHKNVTYSYTQNITSEKRSTFKLNQHQIRNKRTYR